MRTINFKRTLTKLFVPWLVFILVTSFLIYQQLLQSQTEPLENLSRITISKTSNTIYSSVSNVKRDLIFLANHEKTQRTILSPTLSNKNSLAVFFQAFSEASGVYGQIRWIDNTGMEQLRINLKERKAIIVDHDSLQSKAKRYYFLESLKLKEDEFYFSPMDLNVEYNEIEIPWKPVLRAVTPIYRDDGTRAGFIVLNYLTSNLLETLRETSKTTDIDLFLINQQGYWLLSPQRSHEWGFMFNKRELNMAVTYPSSWRQINQTDAGLFIDKNGMWNHEKIALSNDKQHMFHWKLVSNLSKEKLNVIFNRVLLQTLAIMTAFIFLAFFVCHKIAKSVVQLQYTNQNLRQKSQELAHSKKELETSLEIQKETQNELVQASKLSSMGLMVAGVAHELNTPIGSIQVTLTSLNDDCDKLQKAYLEGLRESDVKNYLARYKEGSAIIQSNLSRSAELVKSFKRLAVDRKCEEQRVFQLITLIDDLNRAIWSRNNILSQLINIDVSEEIEIDSYPGALGQVIENLVSNAFLHGLNSQPKGTISISAEITNSSLPLKIQIEDNGCGISQENLSQIFEPFFTTRRGNGGTGLGLHLAYQLTHQVLNGTLSLESEINKGTIFTLQLPLRIQTKNMQEEQ